MARQGKGILGAPSKSVGMITGQKHSGKDTIRSKPKPSIKTQTQKLLKTKSNFQIANEFWDLVISMGWANVKNTKIKQKTIKNKFIGEVIKILSITESGTYKFNPFPPSYYTFKWKTAGSLWAGQWRSVIRWGYQPYPEKSKPTDVFLYLTYVQSTNEVLINGRSSGFNRKTGIQQWARGKTLQPQDKYIYMMVFMDWDWNYISNGIANIKIQP